MTDPLTCPACSFANTLGAEQCAKCGTALAEIPERVHPGETRRDPDDLTLPPSPLLRAVLRGEPDAFASERATATRVAAVPTPAVATTEPAPAQVTSPTPIATTMTDSTKVVSAPPPVAAAAEPVTPAAPSAAPAATPAAASAMHVTPAAASVTPASANAAPAGTRTSTSVAPPAVNKATVEQLSPSADQAVLLRELAERLHVRRAEPVVRYAGFFVRVVAFLVDGAVLAIFGFPLAAACYFGVRAGSVVLGHSAPLELDESLATLLVAAWFTMATVYFTVLHRSYGQTIGKSLLGLEVRTIDLRRLGMMRSLVRTLGYAVSSSFLGFGFLLVALTPRKRGWHDFLARTCVVKLAVEDAT